MGKSEFNTYIRFSGSVSYTINFDTVTMNFDKIEHDFGSTGTMKVSLWAVINYAGGYPFRGMKWEATGSKLSGTDIATLIKVVLRLELVQILAATV